MPSSTWLRRMVIKHGLMGAGAMALGTTDLLQGVARAAAPTRADTKIRLVVSVDYAGYNAGGGYQGVPQALVDEYIASHWAVHHPGVTVTSVAGSASNGPNPTAGQVIAASLAGDAVDTVTGCCDMFAQYVAADLLLPLDSLLRRDNVDLADFSPGHLAALRTDKGQMALPAFDDPAVLIVNEGMLDELGLPYPAPDWTWEEATKLWHDATHRAQKATVSGAGLQLIVWDDYAVQAWLLKGWGGQKYNASGTRALLDSPQDFAAVDWAVPMVWSGVATTNVSSPTVARESAVMAMSGGGDVQGSVVLLQGFKWNYYPMPKFPIGKPSTWTNNDFCGINQYSTNPRELVWDIFKFMTTDKGFQQLLYRTQLVGPNRKSLWPDWIEVARTVAPVLRNVNLESKVEALDYGWSTEFMRYQPLQAQGIEAKYWAQMLGEQIDLRAGLELMTRQLNALEAAGPVLQAAESRERAVYLAEVKKAEAAKGAIQFPAPSRSGLVPARGLVQVGAGGTYTLTGNGGAGIGGAGDNGVFAAAAATSSLGTFTCRLVSVRPAKGVAATDLANGAVVGLMARDNLTPTAASLGVEFVLDRGLNFHERALDGDPLFARNRAGSWPGLLSQAAVQTANAGPSGNLLLKPVWFRLVLDVNKWMPFTSLDGYSWTAAGAPTPVEFAGCWVGLFASSNTAGKALIAVFDNVTGFRPDTFAQLGTP